MKLNLWERGEGRVVEGRDAVIPPTRGADAEGVKRLKSLPSSVHDYAHSCTYGNRSTESVVSPRLHDSITTATTAAHVGSGR
jgi:hypothetical protein